MWPSLTSRPSFVLGIHSSIGFTSARGALRLLCLLITNHPLNLRLLAFLAFTSGN